MPAYAIYPGHEYFDRYLDLRYRILRQPLGLPRGSELDEVDHYPKTRHLVWMEGDIAIGCLQLQEGTEPGVARVRYMAVADEAQGQGIGRTLLEFMDQLADEEGYHELSLYARENAVPFYLACGYTQHEELVPFHGIRHWRMTKRLA